MENPIILTYALDNTTDQHRLTAEGVNVSPLELGRMEQEIASRYPHFAGGNPPQQFSFTSRYRAIPADTSFRVTIIQGRTVREPTVRLETLIPAEQATTPSSLADQLPRAIKRLAGTLKGEDPDLAAVTRELERLIDRAPDITAIIAVVGYLYSIGLLARQHVTECDALTARAVERLKQLCIESESTGYQAATRTPPTTGERAGWLKWLLRWNNP